MAEQGRRSTGRPERPAVGSFGRPDPPPPDVEMKPILNVGEIHASLRLSIDDESLRAVGGQIATMVANATRQGFAAGFDAALTDHGMQIPDELDDDAVRRAQEG